MEQTIYRVAVLLLSGFLVWVFNEPNYLFCLALMFLFRVKETRTSITAEFDGVHDRLDMLVRNKETTPEKE